MQQSFFCKLEKKLLAVVFALQRFDQNVYGQEGRVEFDHQALEMILKNPITAVRKRMQQMILELHRYELELVCKPGPLFVLADTSQAYLQAHTREDESHAVR